MSSASSYGILRKIALRVEAACDLCWVTLKMKREPWSWAREHLAPASGRVDKAATVEIENAAHSVAGTLPFTALCVPITVTAMRMLKRRGIAAKPLWTPPGVRDDRGHVRLDHG
jgi:hypothetical protein